MVLAEYFGTTRNFSIFATDLCTQALRTARQAVYPNELGKSIPSALRQKYTLTGRGSQAGRFRIVPELRERVTFDYANLIAADWQVPGVMNVVFCRNVMIYFDLKTRSQIVGEIPPASEARRHLFIGHSETLNGIDRGLGFVQVRPTVYALQPPMQRRESTWRAGKIRVLIVDDSAVVRQALSEILQSDPDIAVMGVAADPYIAAEKMAIRDP